MGIAIGPLATGTYEEISLSSSKGWGGGGAGGVTPNTSTENIAVFTMFAIKKKKRRI